MGFYHICIQVTKVRYELKHSDWIEDEMGLLEQVYEREGPATAMNQ